MILIPGRVSMRKDRTSALNHVFVIIVWIIDDILYFIHLAVMIGRGWGL